jgi:MFS family permease
MAQGAGMLIGTVAGGVVAQVTNLGVPYVLRAVMLGLTFLVAFIWMHDIGFTPRRSASVLEEVRSVLRASLDQGLRNPPVRWMMLAGVFSGGVSIYGFYAMQPYLLQLRGRSESYAIAGLAAALVAAAQIGGGFMVPWSRKVFRRRTSALLFGTFASASFLLLMGLFGNFWLVLALLAGWAVVFAATIPIRQAFLNGLIPSEQRATVLSFDNLLSSSGGVICQPALGKVADVWGYPTSYVVAAAIELLAIPFVLLARGRRAPSDPI